MFGTNDVLDSEDGVRGFRFRLDQIVQQGRDVGATVVLQTPPAVRSEGERTPEALADYAQAVREVGQSLGVLVVDHAAAWAAAVGSGSAGSGSAGSGPAGSEPGSSAPEGWLDDAFHPGPVGHHALALTLLEALDLADPSSAVCQLARESIAALA
jgi:lysophospholipase L1-like esterase